MTCYWTRRQLSPRYEGDLSPRKAHRVDAHLRGCVRCARAYESLCRVSRQLRDLPRLDPGESIASRVLDRLELEQRGPGLSLLFRNPWTARPFLSRSLATATLALVLLLAVVVKLAYSPIPEGRRMMRVWLPAAGTEGNPLPPLSRLTIPRSTRPVIDTALTSMGEGTLFVETVVARDGSVADVKLLGGDALAAGAVLDALREERYEPGQLDGRPVAVSLYRLISRMDVGPGVSPTAGP